MVCPCHALAIRTTTSLGTMSLYDYGCRIDRFRIA
jgi:hypothetical protein